MGSSISSVIEAGDIRSRLAHTSMPEDPLAACESPYWPRWPEALREQLLGGLQPAGVLIPLIDRADGISVLLTQRSAHLKTHAGQVSFPGGRMEAGDADIQATALRETFEEVGIGPQQVETVGFLPPMMTITAYAVTPVIGIVDPAIEVVVDSNEVEEAFEVPLPFLLDESNQCFVDREIAGSQVKTIEFRHGGRRIWGATAMMLVQLRRELFKK